MEESFVLVRISEERFLSIIVEKPRRYLVDQKVPSSTEAGTGCLPELTSTCDLLPPAVPPCPLSKNSATSWDDISKWGTFQIQTIKATLIFVCFIKGKLARTMEL